MSEFLRILKPLSLATSLAMLPVMVIAQDDTNPADFIAEPQNTGQTESPVVSEDLNRWPFFLSVEIPAPIDAQNQDVGPGESTRRLVDIFATSDLFEHATHDLSDLRLHDSTGSIVPHALRVLSAKSIREEVTALEFNRSEPEAGLHELTLDLVNDDVEHNEIVVQTSGREFRRPVTVSGSVDGKDWKPLATGFVFHMSSGEQALANSSFSYATSRYRFVRVAVTPDPQASGETDGADKFTFEVVRVLRSLEVPAELVVTPAKLGLREPTRFSGSPGSRWILDFGATIPCDRLEVQIADAEFARDVILEGESVNLMGQPSFYPIYIDENTTWQRRLGERTTPMTLNFSELQSRRFRLTFEDYRNKPLTITSVTASAAARQIVFELPEQSKLPLKLYFGNSAAAPANYDFARNLPDALSQVPLRATWGASELNPGFVALPKAFTERFPWLIYVALGSVSVVLGIVILNLSKAAIALHDGTDRHEKADARSTVV